MMTTRRGFLGAAAAFVIGGANSGAVPKWTKKQIASFRDQWRARFAADGILEHATFTLREQHKQLYADCLGPWFENLSNEEVRDTTFAEFNVGDLDEQATAIAKLVGRLGVQS
jgi:hypothetical protein